MTSATVTSVGLRSERGPVLAAVMTATSLVARRSSRRPCLRSCATLAGSRSPLAFSIYLLTQAVTVPLYGKLADVVGRRPVMPAGQALVPTIVATREGILDQARYDGARGVDGLEPATGSAVALPDREPVRASA